MPRINITKMPDLICEHCGNRLLDSTHCEITTATNKVIKMHTFCAVDFAVEILDEFGKTEDFRRVVDEKIAGLICNIRNNKKETEVGERE